MNKNKEHIFRLETLLNQIVIVSNISINILETFLKKFQTFNK